MFVLDGAYLVATAPPVFRRIASPSEAELQVLVERLAARIGRRLERQGVLVRDAESSYLGLDPEAGSPMDDLPDTGGVHLTRYHGVLAPHAALRAAITPAGRGAGARNRDTAAERPTPKHVALTWARRLKRVFGIEIEQCVRCGGKLTVIASIEEPEVIERILKHRGERGRS